MNLPSIFKSAPAMKPTNQPQKNERIDNVPQDMFGLGIQVFKIQSKKQIMGNARSVGKARQEIKVIENPRKTNNIPAVPKPKKTSALLPSINKTPSQKEYKLEGITKTDSILSRKSIEKPNQFMKKIDAIQQYAHNPINHKNNIGKNKTFNSGRTGNKSVDAVPQQQPPVQLNKTCIVKQQWRSSLNILRKFYTEQSEYRGNEQSKAGRKKNQQYLVDQTSFIEAYISSNEQNFYTSSSLYDPFGIEHYSISAKQSGFVDMHYQDYGMAERQ